MATREQTYITTVELNGKKAEEELKKLMSWSKDGSGALATIAVAKRNNEQDCWIYRHEVSFTFAA